MKTILLPCVVILLVTVLGTEASLKQTHAEILDIIHKLSDYGRYPGRKHGHGHLVVGFSASLGGHLTAVKNDQAVVFGNVQTNIGNHYNKHNGIFTAPVDGMYIFEWNMLTNHGKLGNTFLVVNGQRKRSNAADSKSHGGSGYRMGTASVVLSLKRNDRIWITTLKDYFVYGKDWSSFQGWLQNRM